MTEGAFISGYHTANNTKWISLPRTSKIRRKSLLHCILLLAQADKTAYQYSLTCRYHRFLRVFLVISALSDGMLFLHGLDNKEGFHSFSFYYYYSIILRNVHVKRLSFHAVPLQNMLTYLLILLKYRK